MISTRLILNRPQVPPGYLRLHHPAHELEQYPCAGLWSLCFLQHLAQTVQAMRGHANLLALAKSSPQALAGIDTFNTVCKLYNYLVGDWGHNSFKANPAGNTMSKAKGRPPIGFYVPTQEKVAREKW